ncbi:MAG: hypothetical protein QOD42_2239 [Sphingomonadales bacterium]|jgi:hypothetical protein|nr:hypothetical protein [Sphingomonadales bacterium]
MRNGILLGLIALLAAAPASAQSVDDPVFLRSIRSIGDNTSGRRVANNAVVDKVVCITRENGRLIVIQIRALAPGAPSAQIEVPARAVAILRTRAATPGGNAAPDPDDIAFAARTGLSLFIVGEWATPPVIWEVARLEGRVRVRAIDSDGRPGPWRALAS